MIRKEIKDAINNALKLRIPFYAYKQKQNPDFTFGAQIDSSFKSDSGFRIVPFIQSAKFKAKTIYRQYTEKNLPLFPTSNIIPEITETSTGKQEYIKSVQNCINEINKRKDLSKVVFSRIIVKKFSADDWTVILENLVQSNPNAFIHIFYTPETGCWLGATPETLGEYSNGVFRTVALAGTRKKGINTWSPKDIEEQEYVVEYISDVITRLNLKYTVSEKFTANAGCVEHLCNDFTVYEKDYAKIEDLVNILHPTPALAGMPQKESIDCINKFESHNREYYGGYIGPFNRDEFDYKVNLRCIKFDNNKIQLFAGGGITSKSIAETEYQETESKSQTILSAIF